MKNRILSLLLIPAAFVALVGCASRVKELTTTRIDVVHGTNRVSLVNPKDTEFDEAEIPTPNGVARIKGYRSSANAAAIHAEQLRAESQIRAFEAFGGKLEDGLKAFADRVMTAKGFPDTSRREVVILTNAPLVVLTNGPAK